MQQIKDLVKQRHMLRLTKPRNYRVFEYQDVYLQTLANKRGHGEKAQALRDLIDEAMFNGKRRTN